MATVTDGPGGQRRWVGQAAEVSTITVRNNGDTFWAWDTGVMYEVKDPGVGWEIAFRGIPTPTEVKPATLVPEARSY